MTEYVTSHGTFKCFRNDPAFVEQMRQGKLYEEEIVYAHLKPYIQSSTVILDIGAHIGSHSIMYATINPAAEIHAFEPQSRIFELLQHNTSLFPNVTTYNKAVGHKNQSCCLDHLIHDGYNQKVEYGTDKPLNLGGMQLGLQGEKTEMITIDSLNLEWVDYMKIDTEGAENLVLTGAMNLIKKCKPVIFFEKNYKFLTRDVLETLDATHIPDSLSILKDYTFTRVGDNIIAKI